MSCRMSFCRGISVGCIIFRPVSVADLHGQRLSAVLDIAVWNYPALFLNISAFYPACLQGLQYQPQNQ